MEHGLFRVECELVAALTYLVRYYLTSFLQPTRDGLPTSRKLAMPQR